jgi:lipoate-protein ligase A
VYIDDQILARAGEDLVLEIWVPNEAIVVLGAANQAERELHLAACDKLTILKRAGGGGTVVLYPGCVIISLGCWVKNAFHNSDYFRKINHAVIEALGKLWPGLQSLSQNGFSDIVWGEQKVAGTSLFRSKHYLLYQGSLLVSLDMPLIQRTLAHPSVEPSYRQGKSHESFLTSLDQLEPGLVPKAVRDGLAKLLPSTLQENLALDLVESDVNHAAYLRQRAQRNL